MTYIRTVAVKILAGREKTESPSTTTTHTHTLTHNYNKAVPLSLSAYISDPHSTLLSHFLLFPAEVTSAIFSLGE